MRFRSEMASSARFASIVKAAGTPEVYLLWKPPGKDRALQRFAKEHRVMTLMQTRVGAKKDHGEVGLARDLSGQVLIFPRSLAKFQGKKVVGVDYDLLKKEPLKPGGWKPVAKKSASSKKKAGNASAGIASAGDAAIETSALFRNTEDGKEETTRTDPAKAPKPEKRQARKQSLAIRKSRPKQSAQRAKKKVIPLNAGKVAREAKAALKAWDSGNQLPAYKLLERLAD